jgi:predicted enzyme related to lactoylglutathione lyase
MSTPTGFGGISVRAKDHKALNQWYQQHLGLVKHDHGYYYFPIPTLHPEIVFSFTKQDDASFPPAQQAMINLQVADLFALLDRLAEQGVNVDPKRDTYDFGLFGWITDPEGNRIQLWQPINND